MAIVPPGSIDTGLVVKDVHSPLDIKSVITKAVADIVPAGSKGAVVGVLNSNGDVHFVVASKIGENWTLAGSLDKDGKGLSGKVMVSGTW